MTIEVIGKKGPFGLIKSRKEVFPSKPYSFIPPPGISKRAIEIVTSDVIRVCDVSINNGSLRVKCLSEEQINEAKLTIPGKNGKSVKLRWRQG